MAAEPTILSIQANPELIAQLKEAIRTLGLPHVLVLVPGLQGVRSYLEDAQRTGRLPALVVVTADSAGVAVAAWMKGQRNAIAEIPIIRVGSDARSHHVDSREGDVSTSVSELAQILRGIA